MPKTFGFWKIIRVISSYRSYLSLTFYIYYSPKRESFQILGGTVGSGAGLSVSLGIGLDVSSAYLWSCE